MPKTIVPLLDNTQAAFISQGVSINIATRDRFSIPTITRALACRVSPDQRQVTLFLSAERAERLLENIAHNGMIAVVFSQPSTHRTLQLKGVDAHRVVLQGDDYAIIPASTASLVTELTAIGHGLGFSRTIVAHNDSLIAIRFTPDTIFDQTPGPDAGRQLNR
ncbi:MAG: hypothetical protein R3F53_25890 [Gammaproteobacteria bacterium]